MGILAPATIFALARYKTATNFSASAVAIAERVNDFETLTFGI
jgi:hypothetical protein